jgi:Tfp pilus assembly protein FimT
MAARGDAGRRAAGVSALEVAVTMAIVGLVLVLLVPRLNSRPHHLTADVDELRANAETARMLARSRTGRYRVRVAGATQYVIERGVLVGSAWTFPTVERTVELRAGVMFSAGSVGQTATFDSRGRLTTDDTTFTLQDAARGWSRRVVVRATGMVEVQ